MEITDWDNSLKVARNTYIPHAIKQWRTEVGFGGSTPPPITNALQNRAKLNPIVKNVKNCWI